MDAVYYSERMRIKVSKRCIRQSPGETRYKLFSPIKIVQTALNSPQNNVQNVLLMNGAHLNLGVLGFYWRSVHKHIMLT